MNDQKVKIKWQSATLGEVLSKIIGGGTPSKANSNFWNGNIPWATVKDMSDGVYQIFETQDKITEEGLKNSSANLIPKGSIVISTRMGLGRCFKAGVDLAINQDLKALIPNGKIDNEFLLWLYASKAKIIESMGAGTTVKGIRLEQLKALSVELPPMSVQKKIASIFSAFDDLIENNTKRIKLLERTAQLIYKEWFVNFKFAEHEKVKMIDSKTEFGKIPENWEISTIGKIMKFNYGKALKAPDRAEGDILVYGSSGVVGKHNKALVPAPSIVVGRKGNVGSVFWVSEDFYPIDTTFYITTDSSLIYCYFLLKNETFVSGDAAVPGLNRSHAYLKSAILPDKSTLINFEKVILTIFEELQLLGLQNGKLGHIRDFLLPKFMRGEIDL